MQMCVTITCTPCLLLWTFTIAFYKLTVVQAAVDCMMDSSKGPYDPENVYQCPTDSKCCMEEGKPSCCKNKATQDEILDQVLLWGCVIGAAITVAILICCCRRDTDCCERDKTCKYYLTCGCCCQNNSKNDQRYDDIDYKRFPPPSPTSSIKTTTTLLSTSNMNGDLLIDTSIASPNSQAPQANTPQPK